MTSFAFLRFSLKTSVASANLATACAGITPASAIMTVDQIGQYTTFYQTPTTPVVFVGKKISYKQDFNNFSVRLLSIYVIESSGKFAEVINRTFSVPNLLVVFEDRVEFGLGSYFYLIPTPKKNHPKQ